MMNKIPAADAVRHNRDWEPPSTPVKGAPPLHRITRPRFSLIACLFDFFLPPVLLAVVLPMVGVEFYLDAAQVMLLFSVLLVAYVALRLRRLVIWGILIYQRFAPRHVRRACVFEPSCSEYMLRSLERYGLLPGIVKGVGRLMRCHEPNGGVDEP
jgi:putative component of membrane protein insertase Oxa1/YidC/SpoIIIJ protein YidD